MESNKKVKVSVIIRHVSDKQENELTGANSDEWSVMEQIKRLLTDVSPDNDEEDKEKLVNLLEASKLSNEVLANALIEADREDLFDEKVKSISSIRDLIEKINNYI